ncbi:hypothetical protein DWS23_12765 [Escherichia coli]|nr:hypothetical protein C1192_17015 [Escherichia marmotae]EFN9755651.1 hypothetical protein [Escherichia coli]PSS41347.1 hypothetical protein BEM40_006315 [Escherichia sp. MOD1-EC5451]PSY64336.1 hypothetical protein C7B16_15605 [Escherichia sp. 20412-1]EFO1360397.1 hypothetical protein [Escherichia coli]
MYTPESILFPYLPRFSAPFHREKVQLYTGENQHYAPGGGLYGLPDKAQGSSRIFIRSIKPNFVYGH